MRIAANAVNRDTFDIFDGRLHFVEVGTRNTFRKFPTSVNNRRDRLFAFRTTIINTSVVHPIRRQLLRSVFIGKLTPTIRPVTIYYTRFNEYCDSITTRGSFEISIFNDWKWNGICSSFGKYRKFADFSSPISNYFRGISSSCELLI